MITKTRAIEKLRHERVLLLHALDHLARDYEELWSSGTDDEVGKCDDPSLLRAKELVNKSKIKKA